MIEGAVNHSIRFGRPAPQAFRVFKISLMHLGSRGNERPGAGVGPGQSEHLMTRVDKLRNYGRSDKPRRSRQKHTYAVFSFRPVRVAIS